MFLQVVGMPDGCIEFRLKGARIMEIDGELVPTFTTDHKTAFAFAKDLTAYLLRKELKKVS